MQWLEWYRIVARRAGHAAPRYVLVANEAGDAFWILDGGDDDAASLYTIHDAGSDLDEAMARFEGHASGEEALDAFGCIPSAHVEFDETGQGALKLTGPPIT